MVIVLSHPGSNAIQADASSTVGFLQSPILSIFWIHETKLH